MKNMLLILFFTFIFAMAKADSLDHWMILVNGQRVFECPATCSANGLNLNMLKANFTLRADDKVTIVYEKPILESNVTKYFIITDSAVTTFQSFSVYDEEGTHAVTVKASDFNSLHGIVVWYSEKKKKKGMDITTQRVPLVYFE